MGILRAGWWLGFWGLCLGWSACGAEVKAWALPEGGNAEDQAAWRPAEKGTLFKAGAVLRNERVQVTVLPGAGGAILKSVRDGAPGSVTVNLVSAKDAKAVVGKLELLAHDKLECVLRLQLGEAQADLKLKAGQVHLEVVPLKELAALEVSGKTSYVVLPDFFGYDTVYDPRRFKSETLLVPAESLLLGLGEGGGALFMCVWQGLLSLGKQPEEGAKEARVELGLGGEGAGRKVERVRIECTGKPVYVALLAQKGLWHEEDVSAWPAQKVTELTWQRPFEARWRANFLGKEDGWSNDMFARNLSNDMLHRDSPARWEGEVPKVSLQGLWPYFIYPFWSNKEKSCLALYSDMKERKAVEGRNNAEKAAAKKENREFVPAFPKNIFERAVIYPLDRHKDTPLGEFTPVDIVRETLGQGPCEYVLDLEGLKARPGGGTRETLGATCGIFDNHINNFVAAARGQNTHYKVKEAKLAGLKPGEKFPPEFEERLVQALEDMGLFVTAVNARVVEYRQFAGKMSEYCEAEGKRSEKIKPLADKILEKAKQLAAQADRVLPNMTKQREEWVAKIATLVAEVKEGNYKNIASSGGIRPYAESQDVFISFTRRFVKAMSEEASKVDSSDPEVVGFSAKVRGICRNVLRNKHGMEGW